MSSSYTSHYYEINDSASTSDSSSLPYFCNPSLPSCAHLELVKPDLIKPTLQQQHEWEVEEKAIEVLNERANSLGKLVNNDADLKELLQAKLTKLEAEIKTRVESLEVAKKKVMAVLDAQNEERRVEPHKINATRLAERVIYNFRKHYTKRFGESLMVDFYDGSSAHYSKSTPITFDPIFVEAVRVEADKYDICYNDILNSLTISSGSATRFADFIKIGKDTSNKKPNFNIHENGSVTLAIVEGDDDEEEEEEDDDVEDY